MRAAADGPLERVVRVLGAARSGHGELLANARGIPNLSMTARRNQGDPALPYWGRDAAGAAAEPAPPSPHPLPYVGRRLF